jgi:hypothetical protein
LQLGQRSLYRETRPRRRLPTRISSRSGRTLTPTSRFSGKRNRNTPSYRNVHR